MRVCRDSLDSLGALISMRRFRFWTIVSELQNPFYTMFIVSVKKSILSLDENVTLMSHLIQRWVSSHIYSDGACFYFIYVWIHPRLFIICWNPFPCLFFLDDNSNALATCSALRKTLLSVPLTSPIHPSPIEEFYDFHPCFPIPPVLNSLHFCRFLLSHEISMLLQFWTPTLLDIYHSL